MILQGDCIEQMRTMDEASVDAIVTDPPYGLEFMGKEWDRLDADLPQENVWKRRRGKGGSNIGTDDTKPSSRHRVALGAGKQHGFRRCQTCGKREFSGSPCECEAPDFVLEYRQGAPSSSVRMQRWHEQWAREAYRVLKPGGHLLAFGGTRTSHRLACAIEDAGFEIRDTICWLYGSGFPKSLDVSKVIDKAAGAEREVVGRRRFPDGTEARATAGMAGVPGSGAAGLADLTAPATPEAEKWNGWGTALKPAHEPIVVARKPLSGTVVQTVLEHGTGALHVDGCRIEGDVPQVTQGAEDSIYGGGRGLRSEPMLSNPNPSGRWPANVVLDEEAGRLLDEQTGERPAGVAVRHRSGGNTFGGENAKPAMDDMGYGDSGGASRFFYCAKASRSERNAGLDGTPLRYGEERDSLPQGEVHRYGAGIGEGLDPTAPAIDRNVHPTVKPIALMRWLVRLVTPPEGTVLDPFAGSGTTGCAAVLEGFDFIGIEREPEYVEIAKARIAYWKAQPVQLGLEAV